jgi:hypothetical protein
MATHSPEGSNPYNIEPKTVRVAPEQRRFGSGFEKPETQGIQGADKPTSAKPFITEAEMAVNERWRAINKKMERYTQGQEDRISKEWFGGVTAWCKSHGFTSKEDFKPENFTRERQLVYSIETAAILEACMERESQRWVEEQDASGDSSSGSST